MPLVLENRVKTTSTTTGTGNLTLSTAATGFQSFAGIGNNNDTYYCITDGTDWEVGKGKYISTGTLLTRDTIYESSNGGSKVNWTAGTRDVFCMLPAEAGIGGISSLGDSSITTDLQEWRNFSTLLNKNITGGATFNTSVVTTYSLLVTALSGSHIGGVVAADGEIHFVPYNSRRLSGVGTLLGQKITRSGSVATYSLVYTTPNAYSGGVLDQEGSIHFVPSAAAVGQKVSASGVVSTYSLRLTLSTGAYGGGVVAPNGVIHFIPVNASRGQRVNIDGTVSTYSLAYTTTDSYAGGCLAPDGTIHFVPNKAVRGQKLDPVTSTSSTYALVYTITTQTAYVGGVLDSEGSIHFVPLGAAVGQKVSRTGVVSTYSLVYTATAAYAGGILAPNGDVHFIPYGAVVGQKVSKDGVVSTYSLAYTQTSTNAYDCGVLGPDGCIHYAALTAPVGQKVNLLSGEPYSLGVTCSPFFNKGA